MIADHSSLPENWNRFAAYVNRKARCEGHFVNRLPDAAFGHVVERRDTRAHGGTKCFGGDEQRSQ